MNLVSAIDEVLDDLNEDLLHTILEQQTDTTYRLAALKNKMDKNPSVVGICGEIQNYHLVEALSPTWEHFSGNFMYPVPGHDKNRDPEEAYCQAYPHEEKWIGQQKRYRFSLIDHLLKNAPAFYKAIEKRLK